MSDHYSVLGVKADASGEEIKKAYRTLSLRHHPDRPGGDITQFQKINTAYETLGDLHKKQMYDLQMNSPLLGALGTAFPQEEFAKMFFGGGLQRGQNSFGQQFFPAGARVHIFGRGQPGHMGMRLQKPAPIIKSIDITLVQAYTGANIPVEVERWIYEEGLRKMERERVYVDIHAGIDENEMVILRDQGNIMDNGATGDIKIFIKITNHSQFKRQGLNLVYTKKISLKEALAGFAFDLKHLSGKIYTINNTNGKVIHPSYVKAVPNMGMRRKRPHPASPIVGDLIIGFDIKFPTHLSVEQRSKLVEIL